MPEAGVVAGPTRPGVPCTPGVPKVLKEEPANGAGELWTPNKLELGAWLPKLNAADDCWVPKVLFAGCDAPKAGAGFDELPKLNPPEDAPPKAVDEPKLNAIRATKTCHGGIALNARSSQTEVSWRRR